MKILVTGNLGYVGSVLTKFLTDKGLQVVGFDSGFFKECRLDATEDIKTNFKDIRDFSYSDLDSSKVIVHLAALSNDPVGELDKSLTFDINFKATVNCAKIAKENGVKKFIFASTQSIYGYSKSEDELDEDNSLKNPQTAYAESKWLAEQELMKMSNEKFKVIALRPATVFGWSPRLRTDIVFNNLITAGYFTGQINVHSDGLPWRPVIHINDVCKAIHLAINSDCYSQAFNLGIQGGNFRVKELAEVASKSLGNIPILYNTENIVDSRTYKVDFKKATEHLGFNADISLEEGATEIINKLKNKNCNYTNLVEKTNRLLKLKSLIETNFVTKDLRIK